MDGGPQRTLLLTVRYAAAGIGRQALNVLLIPLYTVYLDPKDFGVLALLTISGTLVLRTVETPVGNALQRFYFRPDYSDRRDVLLFNLMLFAGANVLAILFLYRFVGNALAALLFHDPALAATVRLHGFVVAFSITTSLTGIFVMLLERSRIYTIASILNVVVTGVVSVSLLYFARLGVTAVVLGQAAGLLFQTLLCLPLLVQHAERVLNRDVLREPLRFGYATLVSGYSNILIIAGDRYLLGFLRTVNEVGLYSFGCNIGNMVTLAIGTPVISGVWPTIRRMETRVEEQRAFVRQVTTFVCVAGAALAVVLSIFARVDSTPGLAARVHGGGGRRAAVDLFAGTARAGRLHRGRHHAGEQARLLLGDRVCRGGGQSRARVFAHSPLRNFGGRLRSTDFVRGLERPQSLFLDEVLPAAVRRAAIAAFTAVGSASSGRREFLAHKSEPAHFVAVKRPLGRCLPSALGGNGLPYVRGTPNSDWIHATEERVRRLPSPSGVTGEKPIAVAGALTSLD